MKRVISVGSRGDEPSIRSAADFGAAVRAARTGAGMSIADAAMVLGIAKQTLSNLETAKGSVGLATALRAANEFGVALFAVPAGDRELVRRAIKGLREGTEPEHPRRVEALPGASTPKRQT